MQFALAVVRFKKIDNFFKMKLKIKQIQSNKVKKCQIYKREIRLYNKEFPLRSVEYYFVRTRRFS